ncbi:hypothetical protein ACHAWO_003171 [Cyclotella atomus]|uniref:Uncharacterized protein n=1 Tax=Cyclotella atomus TaxID=382360 RepID=A0ABD3PI55_9STRA
MKRTNSASCILRPKNSLSQNDLQRLARDPPTATVLTVNKLPSYNADRLYIQSELQVHSTLHILHDMGEETTPSVILYVLWDSELTRPKMFADRLSDKVRECLLQSGVEVEMEELELAKCNPVSTFSPRRQLCDASADEVCLQSPSSLSFDEIESRHHEQSIKIYVVVDKVASLKDPDEDIGELPNFPDLSAPSYEDGLPQCRHGTNEDLSNQTSNDSKQDNEKVHSTAELEQQKRLTQHKKDIQLAESLARAVASSRFLRNRIDGISIGITSDSRAAPGLEACMDAVARSSKERRVTSITESQSSSMDANNNASLSRLRSRSPERSPISIVVCKPDDMDDTNGHTHHHHSCKLLQSRVTVEWNGKGDYNTFSDRAMQDWRRVWSTNVQNKSGEPKRRVPRLSRNEYEDDGTLDEPVSTIMVAVFVIGVAWYLWNCYSDHLYAMAFCDTEQQEK